MVTFARYRNYGSVQEAEAIASLLRANGIATKIEQEKEFLGSLIVGNSLEHRVELHLYSTDFSKADEILLAEAESSLTGPEPDYYLHSFSDQELVEIISKPDEWSEHDFVYAKHLLKERGIEYSELELASLKEKRVESLKQESKNRSGVAWLIAGLICLVLYVYTLHPFLAASAVLLSLIMWRAKKVLPDGTKVFMYEQRTRSLSLILFVVSLFAVGWNSVILLTGRGFEQLIFFKALQG